MLTKYSDWGWNDWALPNLGRTLAELDALRREMDRVFDGQAPERRDSARFARMGLFDRGPQLVLRAELPGVAHKDIDVTVDQGVLTVRGERKLTAPTGYSAHRRERGEMSFARSFNLPCRVDAEKISAQLADGVLTVTLPKAEEEKPRAIAVRAK